MKPNTRRHPVPVSGELGFAGVSACFKYLESAAFPALKGVIFQVPLNPTYVVKSVLCRDLSVGGTSALRLEETFNRTHVTTHRCFYQSVDDVNICLVLRNYQVLRVFFEDPARLGNCAYRSWLAKNGLKMEN